MPKKKDKKVKKQTEMFAQVVQKKMDENNERLQRQLDEKMNAVKKKQDEMTENQRQLNDGFQREMAEQRKNTEKYKKKAHDRKCENEKLKKDKAELTAEIKKWQALLDNLKMKHKEFLDKVSAVITKNCDIDKIYRSYEQEGLEKEEVIFLVVRYLLETREVDSKTLREEIEKNEELQKDLRFWRKQADEQRDEIGRKEKEAAERERALREEIDEKKAELNELKVEASKREKDSTGAVCEDHAVGYEVVKGYEVLLRRNSQGVEMASVSGRSEIVLGSVPVWQMVFAGYISKLSANTRN